MSDVLSNANVADDQQFLQLLGVNGFLLNQKFGQFIED